MCATKVVSSTKSEMMSEVACWGYKKNTGSTRVDPVGSSVSKCGATGATLPPGLLNMMRLRAYRVRLEISDCPRAEMRIRPAYPECDFHRQLGVFLLFDSLLLLSRSTRSNSAFNLSPRCWIAFTAALFGSYERQRLQQSSASSYRPRLTRAVADR